ncbi:hypothetical protein GCM10028805_57440 [Spirosoma harenae]
MDQPTPDDLERQVREFENSWFRFTGQQFIKLPETKLCLDYDIAQEKILSTFRIPATQLFVVARFRGIKTLSTIDQ